MSLPIVITVDGPSGAGKGTLCRLLSKKLDYKLLDSGALYRLTGVACNKLGVSLEDESKVAVVAKNLKIEFIAKENTTKVILNGEDVSLTIRTEQAGMDASKVGANTLAREALLDRQRTFAQMPGLIADGRDMGTVIFPHAAVKFFLTASAEARADRRLRQLMDSGIDADYEKILHDIERRDEQDRNRAAAPLIPAEDALEIDSTSLSIQEVLDLMLSKCSQALRP